MKTIYIIFISMLAFFTSGYAQTSEDQLLGSWESDAKDVRMEFFKSGDKYYGKLLWAI